MQEPSEWPRHDQAPPPSERPTAPAELRGDEFLGANVTIPHKERVVPMVDRLTEEASFTGAVNTLTSGDIQPRDVMPLQHQSDALDTENKDSVLNTVKGATTTLNSSGLLGGLPVGG